MRASISAWSRIFSELTGGSRYCMTKLVKYTASTFSGLPPAPATILRTAARVCVRSASLPSRVETTEYFWPPNNMSRSLRTTGSLVFSSSMVAGSRDIQRRRRRLLLRHLGFLAVRREGEPGAHATPCQQYNCQHEHHDQGLLAFACRGGFGRRGKNGYVSHRSGHSCIRHTQP